ncbi:GAF and ANTAR domain-containing protein [Paenarthrobacter sp. CCNWLY172]|uniref:GAF and ANTAR domain-containing protein n=1 Tax=Paenarthrobacter sp. AMU7 TaxID=3162492 RepID=A0AB39YVX8_9MICC|nr:GAF and ANTAR domain-containing protein [Paenarthrobacter sp. OM7]WGM22449.1 GAF and ANTAR domain-containing protein [Paenarthrobacter sp. OM7]
MTDNELEEGFDHLNRLITSTDDLKGFLQGMAGLASEKLTHTEGTQIECAVALHRRKRRTTIAGSSDIALWLDQIEQRLGEGPCVEALELGKPMIVSDAAADQRWPNYCRTLTDEGYRSAMGIPLELGADADAVLDFFAAPADQFTPNTVEDARVFGDMAGRALRLAVRITTAEQLADDLRSALESRTVIDLACGMIMAQNRCSQVRAMEILKKASSDRNQKLHVVAENIVQRVNATYTSTFFEK